MRLLAAIRAFAIETAAFPPELAWSALLVDSFTTAASLVILWRYLRGDAWRDPWYAWMLVACATAVSVARTGLPHTNHTPASTQPAPGIAGVALNRTSSSNGHRHPAELALALPQDRTPGADHDPAAAANVRQRVRALVARERSGGQGHRRRGRRGHRPQPPPRLRTAPRRPHRAGVNRR